MKTKNTFWILVSLLVSVSMLVVACGGATPTEAPPEPAETEAQPEEPAEPEAPAGEAVTVEVWFHSGKGEERDVLDAQVADFNAM